MSVRPMKDLVIVLPGIMGSVLTKNGKELWAASLGMVARVAQREALQRDLVLEGDDPERPTLDDGVVATRILPDAQIIPGFWKIDGYTSLITALSEAFGAKVGDIYRPDPKANLFPFPYDWRRDNRSSARRLETFIKQQLRAWRDSSGHTDAKVILIAHSMGGLIARYYLEVLGGHKDCRGLFTFGTPHRGSLNALGFLANGYTLMKWLDVSAALRSYTSAYQLLPTYKVVNRDGTFLPVRDLGSLANLAVPRARAAYEQFHAPIEQAAEARDANDNYCHTTIIGTRQNTLQSALLAGGALTIGADLPKDLLENKIPTFGDGTVPFFAALPPGAKKGEVQRVYVAGAHAGLQAMVAMQEHLIESMHMLQVDEALLDAGSFASRNQPGLRLHLDDAYPPEGGVVRVEPLDLDEPGELTVTIEAMDEQRPVEQRRVPCVDGVWQIELDRPQPGLYRLTAAADQDVQPVRDLFEVAPAPMA